MERREGGCCPQHPHVCIEGFHQCVYTENSLNLMNELLFGEGGMDVFIRTQTMSDDADVDLNINIIYNV